MYAPVVIPVLNRKKHLERCLLSLAQNTVAKFTDLIISVDYPPSEKYVTGYKEVKKYLTENNFIEKSFKSVNIIFQKTNLGTVGNIGFLKEYARKFSETIIFTEDDNEFSPNFLQYINLGLVFFKDNEQIIGICGCKDTDWVVNEGDSITAVKLFSGYGVGLWLDKDERRNQKITKFLLNDKAINRKSIKKLKARNRVLFNLYINEILFGRNAPFWNNGKLCVIDTTRSIYMHMTKYMCIAPVVSQSRTWGNDGSGVNMRNEFIDPCKKCILDDSSNGFVYLYNGNYISDNSDICFETKNYRMGERYLKVLSNFRADIKADIGYFLLFIYRFNYKKVFSVVKRFKKD